MTFGRQLRGLLLVGTFVGVLLVLGGSILNPVAEKRRVTSFVFPPEVPLPGWQPLGSGRLTESAESHSFLAGKHYRYSRNDLPLDIEMRYGDYEMTTDIKLFIAGYTAIPLTPSHPLLFRQQQGVGFYNLIAYQERAYLSACINPQGGSTITAEQFNHNRLTYDLRFSRLLPRLLGQESLLDRRCLWAHLSIPTRRLTPESAYPLLEQAWFAWYQWWSPRFPKP